MSQDTQTAIWWRARLSGDKVLVEFKVQTLCVDGWMPVYMCICMYMYLYVYVYVCVYICMYMNMCVCIHVYV